MQASAPKSRPSQPLKPTVALNPKPKRRGRPKTGVKTPWKELGLSKATYYRRIRTL
jgi:hypothetical protein